MEHYDVRRLALVLAVEAEIQGMIYENKVREQQNLAVPYRMEEFQAKADELRNIAYCHDEQL